MRSLLVAGAATILVVACGTGGTRPLGSASATPARVAAASPTPTFNMDDMMGFYPQQTVFVADAEKVSIVTLLNHFTRYSIPTRGVAEVATDTSTAESWLYILDGMEAAAARIEGAVVRLRAFDLQTGTERATRTDLGLVSGWKRALATVGDGRILVLKSDARHAWVDAYERLTLKPLGMVMEKLGCGDRLLASQARVAIVCLATGEVAIDTLRGAGTSVIGAPPGLAGAAMDHGGTIWLVSADRQLGAVPADAVTLRRLEWPSAWGGTVLADSLAVATGADSLVLAQTDTEGSWLRVLATNVVAPRTSVRLAGRLTGAPQFGVMALYPFAYFTSSGSVRHVEIQSGMLETMTELGQGATIAAVVDR